MREGRRGEGSGGGSRRRPARWREAGKAAEGRAAARGCLDGGDVGLACSVRYQAKMKAKNSKFVMTIYFAYILAKNFDHTNVLA